MNWELERTERLTELRSWPNRELLRTWLNWELDWNERLTEPKDWLNWGLDRTESLTELKAICTIAGGWGKPTRQWRSLIPVPRNQLRKSEIMFLKWMLTTVRNTVLRISRLLRLHNIYEISFNIADRLCGLVVRVSGYRYRGLGFYSRRYQIFWVIVGLERGPLSLVRSIEELLE